MRVILIIFFPLISIAQNVEIGSWKNYRSYNIAEKVCATNEKVFCVNSNSLFYINKIDKRIVRLSKVNGLFDVDVAEIKHSQDLNLTIIAYENCNIDLIKNELITNISDIKRKEIVGEKEINNITIYENKAYLSCSFGLVVIDLLKEEIKDTYSLWDNDNVLNITGTAIILDSIVITTENGIYASNTSRNLSDFNSWSKIDSVNQEYGGVVAFNDVFYVDTVKDVVELSTSNDFLLVVNKNEIELISKNNTPVNFTHELFVSLKDASFDVDGNLWVADSLNGILQFRDFTYEATFMPSGPVRNEIYTIRFLEGRLYMAHGGHNNYFENALINDGVSIKKEYDVWDNNDYFDLGNARDIVGVAVKNGVEYYASWYNGIPCRSNVSGYIDRYGYLNTNGALDTVYYSNNRIRISDIKFDDYGNLWGLSSEVNHPLFVKTAENTWHSYSMNQDVVDLFFDELLIDSQNQKWGVIARNGGLFVYNDNNTISNNDDQYIFLNTNIGSGNLPSNTVYCLVEDNDNSIWIGTDKGVAVIYNPGAVFSGYNFDAQQILIQQGEYGQYLLSEEKITVISVDGANRKWVGTEDAGLFVLSADGSEEILHFTKENSPLFSNNIIDISIDGVTGEVYIGTSKGLMSYRSDATRGSVKQGSTSVFPNPVTPDFEGLIAIKGLTTNANFKVTSISGDIVYEGFANGGQAIWNGKTKNNVRVATGIYLVLSADENGIEKIVSKIVFIK